MVEGERTAGRSDAELVQAFLDGDRGAFAAIFDRHGPAIHGFCTRVLGDPHTAADATQDAFVVAARRLGTLRDPARLRPWLYAVARNECTRQGRARDRVVPVEDVELMAASDRATDDATGAVEAAEVGALLWDAAAGLDDKDRILLELQLRHGLQGAELAEAAGIPAGQISMATGRLQERLERSVGALLVLRGARRECAGLQAVLDGWDGTFSVLTRKRVARHIDACDQCGERQRALVAPLGSLAVVPAVVPFALDDLPEGLRARVLGAVDDALGATPGDGVGGGGRGRRLVAAVAVVVLLLIGAAVGVRALGDDDGPTQVAAGSGAGSVTTTARATTTAARAATTSTTLPRATTTTTAATTPTSPASGGATTTVATTAPGSPKPPPTTTVPPNAAPKVGTPTSSGSATMQTSCNPANDRRTISAPVSDDHGIAKVVLRWTHSSSGAGEKPMVQSGGSWTAVLGPFETAGTATYRVVATDASGRTTSSATGAVTVDPCPG
ncbi:MAG: sigma-70 family RNA polymerase sigma factor [Acidimicrobiales bacterium]